MSDPKRTAKPSVLAGFDWNQSIRKAEQEGTAHKSVPSAPAPSHQTKATPRGNSPSQKQAGSKSQLRLRVKV